MRLPMIWAVLATSAGAPLAAQVRPDSAGVRLDTLYVPAARGIGTAALSLAALASAIYRWGTPGAAWLLGGGALYFVGSFLVTMRGNVPMNEALALVDAGSAAGVEYWQRYVAGWTRWNHVRTAASLAASLSYILVLAG